jgi:hypothetical protein
MAAKKQTGKKEALGLFFEWSRILFGLDEFNDPVLEAVIQIAYQ